jgi:hypothetical protein
LDERKGFYTVGRGEYLIALTREQSREQIEIRRRVVHNENAAGRDAVPRGH